MRGISRSVFPASLLMRSSGRHRLVGGGGRAAAVLPACTPWRVDGRRMMSRFVTRMAPKAASEGGLVEAEATAQEERKWQGRKKSSNKRWEEVTLKYAAFPREEEADKRFEYNEELTEKQLELARELGDEARMQVGLFNSGRASALKFLSEATWVAKHSFDLRLEEFGEELPLPDIGTEDVNDEIVWNDLWLAVDARKNLLVKSGQESRVAMSYKGYKLRRHGLNVPAEPMEVFEEWAPTVVNELAAPLEITPELEQICSDELLEVITTNKFYTSSPEFKEGWKRLVGRPFVQLESARVVVIDVDHTEGVVTVAIQFSYSAEKATGRWTDHGRIMMSAPLDGPPTDPRTRWRICDVEAL